MSGRPFPPTYYNVVSLLGTGIAMFGLAAMAILYLVEAMLKESNPYLGIFIFLVFPAFLVVGLLLIPAGMLLERRRRRRGERDPVVIDLSRRTHRNALIVFVAGTSVFLLLTTIGLYGSFHYSESVEFCGQVCHQVMEPEFVAYHESPHARVKCVTCHIGPGADWYVRSKISGARQVIKTVQRTYPRPVPTPIEDLRPAREVCEQCHWPGKFFSSTEEVWDYFLGDSTNTHWQIRALMHVGGKTTRGEHAGSHWHIDPSNPMTYVATDHERLEFDQITWLQDGEPVTYSRTGHALPDSVLERKKTEGLVRTMDCMDCHNRPAHIYRSPMHAVSLAMVEGAIDPATPFIKQQAVKALSVPYATKEGAKDSIRTALEGFYRASGLTVPSGTVDAVLDVYKQNFFPHMRARWDRYPDHIGHLNFDGCFRCHGSELQTADGRKISKDCNLCHTIVAQGPADSLDHARSVGGLEFLHPVDIKGAERVLACTSCHYGDERMYFPREASADRAGGGTIADPPIWTATAEPATGAELVASARPASDAGGASSAELVSRTELVAAKAKPETSAKPPAEDGAP